MAWWSCSSLDDDWGRAASLGRADTDEYIELVLRSKLSGLGGDFVGATLLRLLAGCLPLGRPAGPGCNFRCVAPTAKRTAVTGGSPLPRVDSRAPGPARRPCSAVRPGTARKLVLAAYPAGDHKKTCHLFASTLGDSPRVAAIRDRGRADYALTDVGRRLATLITLKGGPPLWIQLRGSRLPLQDPPTGESP